MSWNTYVVNLLGTNHITDAAIVGYPSGLVWGKSIGFDIQPDELKAITGGFGSDALSSTGIVLAGEKYFYLQSDENQIQGKKGNCGVSIAKANTCMIIGTYVDGQQPGNARIAVESVADYLRERGY